MTKREYFMIHKPFAYYSGLNGLEIYGVEHGIEDYVYCASNCWSDGPRKYHRLKVHYSTGGAYILLYGQRVNMADCLRF